ncbi:MAG: hypothetical protein EBV08_02050 [Synechococcaceae bacterium WB6_1B_055]|nr:hypothetical protein [Synechococcaceae bacterium WB6_1A_059]NBP32057.1 hypothetical protein [Synechococcaceae bacterium WB6_1B_055]NCU76757.1 hypothetical protein [Synechococcaceae bacterium WB7_1C_051]NCU91809.1 hypothetical protein [Synechococcaceae bacterium WB7_1B_046]
MGLFNAWYYLAKQQGQQDGKHAELHHQAPILIDALQDTGNAALGRAAVERRLRAKKQRSLIKDQRSALI